MFLFSDDGAQLLFIDAHGVTRLAAPNKIKHLKDPHALGASGRVSRNAAGDRALVWAPDWDRLHEVSFPDLKPGRKFQRFQLSSCFLHPDGEHFVRIGSWVGGDPDTLLRTLAAPSTILTRVDLAELPAPELAPIRLEEEPPGFEGGHGRAVALAHDGAFALVEPGRKAAPDMLFLGQLGAKAGDPPTVQLRVPLEYGAGRQLGLWPSRKATTLWVRNLATGDNHGLQVTPTGDLRQATIRALSLPVMADPDTVVFQRTAGELVQKTFTGGDREAFRIPPPRGDTPDHAGRGAIMASGARVLFLPWHGESVVDPVVGREIPRKLPPAQRAVREALARRAAALGPFGHEAHRDIRLEALEVEPARREFSFRFRVSPGDGSLLGAMVAASVLALPEDASLKVIDGHRWTSAGSLASDSTDGRVAGEAELTGALAHFDRHQISLLTAAGFFARSYEALFSSPAAAAPLSPPAERILLRALCAALLRPGVIDAARQAAAWQTEPLGPREAEALLARTLGRAEPCPNDRAVAGALQGLVAHHLDADDAGPLLYLLFDAPPWLRQNSWTTGVQALAWLGQRRPKSAPGLLAAARERAGDRAEFAHGLAQLETELASRSLEQFLKRTAPVYLVN